MSEVYEEPGEGHSPAAWTTVIIMLVAISAGTVFFFFDLPVLVWASVALLLVGLLVGWILRRAGYGVNGPKYQPKQH